MTHIINPLIIYIDSSVEILQQLGRNPLHACFLHFQNLWLFHTIILFCTHTFYNLAYLITIWSPNLGLSEYSNHGLCTWVMSYMSQCWALELTRWFWPYIVCEPSLIEDLWWSTTLKHEAYPVVDVLSCHPIFDLTPPNPMLLSY